MTFECMTTSCLGLDFMLRREVMQPIQLVEEEDGREAGREAPSPGGLATPNEERPAGESGQGRVGRGRPGAGPRPWVPGKMTWARPRAAGYMQEQKQFAPDDLVEVRGVKGY